MSEEISPQVPVTLLGRENELAVLHRFVRASSTDGATLLILGDPGVGKTALLQSAAHTAPATGSRLLRASGVEFEADMSYAGLNQVLLPLSDELGRVSSSHRAALSVALGIGDGPVADRLVVAAAALALLRQAAADRPLLLIIDDLQWLDRASAQALGFLARRLAGTRIGFLAAQRSGEGTFFERVGLATLAVSPLSDEVAAQLVHGRYPALAERVAQRVIHESRGNPLALLELPRQLSQGQQSEQETLPLVLPLSRHLQAIFAARVSALPAATVGLLLLAALDGSGDLRILGPVAADEGVDVLAPAQDEGLVSVDPRARRLVFAHPLIRSAVVGLATSGQRRAAHHRLADLFAGDPDVQARHLSQATVEPDEQVAALLEAAAYRVLRRGDAVQAVAMLIQAADLTPDGARRARRLSDAAYVGADFTGAIEDVSALLERARQADPDLDGSLSLAVVTSYVLLSDGEVDGAHRLLVAAITTFSPARRDRVMEEAFYTLLLMCFFGGRAQLWGAFTTALRQIDTAAWPVLAISASTLADPARADAFVLRRLDTAIAGLPQENDPNAIYRLAIAAIWVDRLPRCRNALMRAVTAGGVPAVRALLIVAVGDFMSGRWDEAEQMVNQALVQLDRQPFPMLLWTAWHAQGLLAAGRGQHALAEEYCSRMRQWSEPRGMIRVIDRYVAQVAGLDALGRGDYDGAYRTFIEISPPGTFAPYEPFALWAVMDLVEAAIHTGRYTEARAHVAAAQEAGLAAVSARLALHCAAAAAMVSTDTGAGARFEQALATPGISDWPFDRARIELAFGERLRRERAPLAARAHLSAALTVFDGLGAAPWAERALTELKATGQTRHPGPRDTATVLTAQEQEIARLAASGMTNKQIGEHLLISPRTVSAHLYRVFPKLGITTRAGLRDALVAAAEPERGPVI
jgi:DNA-binding CsgD family transcriptional regulator/tetratricopeptide (TPR) repeat protein